MKFATALFAAISLAAIITFTGANHVAQRKSEAPRKTQEAVSRAKTDTAKPVMGKTAKNDAIKDILREPANPAEKKVAPTLEVAGESEIPFEKRASWQVRTDGKGVKFSIANAPKRMEIREGEVLWTPLESDLGYFEYDLIASSEGGKTIRRIQGNVHRPFVDVLRVGRVIRSSNGRYLATIERDHEPLHEPSSIPNNVPNPDVEFTTVKVFDLLELKEVSSFTVEGHGVWSLSGKYLASSNRYNNQIRVFRISDGKRILEFKQNFGSSKLYFLNDHMLTLRGTITKLLDCDSKRFVRSSYIFARGTPTSSPIIYQAPIQVEEGVLACPQARIHEETLEVRALTRTSRSGAATTRGVVNQAVRYRNATTGHILMRSSDSYTNIGSLGAWGFLDRRNVSETSSIILKSRPLRVSAVYDYDSRPNSGRLRNFLEYRHLKTNKILGYQAIGPREESKSKSIMLSETDGKVVARSGSDYILLTPPKFKGEYTPLRFLFDEGVVIVNANADQPQEIMIATDGRKNELSFRHTGLPEGASLSKEGTLSINPEGARKAIIKQTAKALAKNIQEIHLSKEGSDEYFLGVVKSLQSEAAVWTDHDFGSQVPVEISIEFEASNKHLECARRTIAFFICVSRNKLYDAIQNQIERHNTTALVARIQALEKRIAELEETTKKD